MNSTTLRQYIDWYKANFSLIFDREGYKWRSVKHFQRTYTATKSDYQNILKNSFSKSKNLLNSQSTFSLGMMLDIVRYSIENPDTKPSGLDIFYALFEGVSEKDSNANVLSKITSFRKAIRQLVRTNLSEKKNDYQDLHAVSVYLSHRYPDRFYIYRTYEFTQFNKLINNKFKFKWGDDSNYISYMAMCDELNAILRTELMHDKGFKLVVDKFIKDDDNCYSDPEYRILTQDFIYSVVSYYNTDILKEYTNQIKIAQKSPTVEYVAVDDFKQHNQTSSNAENSSYKIDYVARQEENTRLGKIGEKWVLEYEKARLISAGRKDLAKKIIWVAESDDSKGYDILSYDTEGSEIYIEVKTTNGGPETPFYISALEMQVNGILQSRYRLYRLYNFNSEPKLRIITGDLSKLNPKPTNFVIYTD